MTARERWMNPKYQLIRSADSKGGDHLVAFADGTRVVVQAAKVLPETVDRPRWEALEFDEYKIRVPTLHEPAKIPWSTIRGLTDAEYSAHLASAAAQQAREV